MQHHGSLVGELSTQRGFVHGCCLGWGLRSTRLPRRDGGQHCLRFPLAFAFALGLGFWQTAVAALGTFLEVGRRAAAACPFWLLDRRSSALSLPFGLLQHVLDPLSFALVADHNTPCHLGLVSKGTLTSSVSECAVSEFDREERRSRGTHPRQQGAHSLSLSLSLSLSVSLSLPPSLSPTSLLHVMPKKIGTFKKELPNCPFFWYTSG